MQANSYRIEIKNINSLIFISTIATSNFSCFTIFYSTFYSTWEGIWCIFANSRWKIVITSSPSGLWRFKFSFYENTTKVTEIKTFHWYIWGRWFFQNEVPKFDCFKFCTMLVKKVQTEFAFSVFFTLLVLLVTEIGTDSFKGNTSLMQFQNLIGLFLFSNNKSFWYFCLAYLTSLLHKFLSFL